MLQMKDSLVKKQPCRNFYKGSMLSINAIILFLYNQSEIRINSTVTGYHFFVTNCHDQQKVADYLSILTNEGSTQTIIVH